MSLLDEFITSLREAVAETEGMEDPHRYHMLVTKLNSRISAVKPSTEEYGMTIVDWTTGSEYALTGEYRRPLPGEDYLAIASGHVYTQPVHSTGMEPSAAPILRVIA